MKKIFALTVVVLSLACALDLFASPAQLFSPTVSREIPTTLQKPSPLPPAIVASLALNQRIQAFEKTIVLKSVTTDGAQFIINVDIDGVPSSIDFEPGVIDSGYFPAHNLRIWTLSVDQDDNTVLLVIGVMH